MSSTSAFLLCLLCVLPQSSVGATLVRTEPRASAVQLSPQVQLSPHGDLIQRKQALSSEPSSGTSTDYCEWDYPLGKVPVAGEDPTDECLNATEETIIDNRDECIKAGGLAGAKTNYDSFELDHWWFDKHPKGCFYMSGCSEDTTGGGHCYFFNDATNEQQHPDVTRTGTPVCRRDKYKYGTKDSKGGAEGGCPTGYEVIMGELGLKGCKSASECLAEANGEPFFIGEHNASRQHDYPVGCFLENMGGAVTQKTVWLNNGTLCAAITGECPSAPQGTPICIVSTETSFVNATASATTCAGFMASGVAVTDDADKTAANCAASCDFTAAVAEVAADATATPPVIAVAAVAATCA